MNYEKIDKLKLKEVVEYLYYLSDGEDILDISIILWLFEGIKYIKHAKKPLDLIFLKTEKGLHVEGLEEIIKDIKPHQVSEKDENIITHTFTIPRITKLTQEEIELISKIYTIVSNDKNKVLTELKNTSYWKEAKVGSKLNPIFVIELFIKRKKLTEEEIKQEKEKFRKYKEGNEDIYIEDIKKELKAIKNELCYS